MSASHGSVKLFDAALDDDKSSGGEIILRGVIDPNSLTHLQVADYQREVLSATKISALVEAFKSGSIPDIDLGMRGEKFTSRDDCFYLQDPVFIVDGLQRVTAALQLLRMATGKLPHLGATVHFNTTEQWERDRFKTLNLLRTALSPNVHLRNLRNDYGVIDMIYKLSQGGREFALFNKICWAQAMKRSDLVTATQLAKVVGSLHSRLGGGGLSTTNDMLAPALQKIMEKIGRNVMRDNIIAFYDLLDDCWRVRLATTRDGTPHLRGTFMKVLSLIFTHHKNFWREDRLFIEKSLREKLHMLDVYDPNIINLASSNGKAGDVLYQVIVNHINSGKRTRRLELFEGIVPTNVSSGPEDVETDPPTAIGGGSGDPSDAPTAPPTV